jgi:hypothetical protein
MKKIKIIIILLLISSYAFSQIPAAVWYKAYGGSSQEFPTSAEKTSDGGYIFAGSTNSSDGDITQSNYGGWDFWVVKTDQNGNKIWQKSYGGTGQESNLKIKQTSDGGYFLVSASSSNNNDVTGNHQPSGGTSYSRDIWVAKLDAYGTIIWSKCIGGSNSDGGDGTNDFSLDFKLTNDGGLIIAAKTASYDGDAVLRPAGPANPIWLFKLNNLGTIQWSNFYGGNGFYTNIHAINKTSDGGYIVACDTRSSELPNFHGFSGSQDFWIFKIDSMGTMQWNKCFGGVSFDIPYDIIQTSDGNYVAVGTSRSTDGDVTGNHGSYDGWMIKISNTGNLLWQKSLGGSRDEELKSVLETSDGGFMILGTTDSYNNGDVSGNHSDCSGCQDLWLVKTNSTGNKLWQVCYGTSGGDYATQLISNNNNSFTLFGNTDFSANGLWTSNFGGDYFAIKLGYPTNIVENSFKNQNIIYPNPANKSVNIISESMKYFKLFDIIGKLIHSSTNNLIDVSNMSKGIYFINLYDSDNSLIHQEKFIKE